MLCLPGWNPIEMARIPSMRHRHERRIGATCAPDQNPLRRADLTPGRPLHRPPTSIPTAPPASQRRPDSHHDQARCAGTHPCRQPLGNLHVTIQPAVRIGPRSPRESPRDDSQTTPEHPAETSRGDSESHRPPARRNVTWRFREPSPTGSTKRHVEIPEPAIAHRLDETSRGDPESRHPRLAETSRGDSRGGWTGGAARRPGRPSDQATDGPTSDPSGVEQGRERFGDISGAADAPQAGTDRGGELLGLR